MPKRICIIQIKLYCEKTKDYISIHVEDTGYGMDELEIKEIFKPFYRIQDNNRIVEGTGIGLAVAKQLVELMNGSIHATSKMDLGSHFVVDLPYIEVEHEI